MKLSLLNGTKYMKKNFKNKMNLRVKLVLLVVCVAASAVVVSAGVNFVSSRAIVEKESLRIISEAASKSAQAVKSDLDASFTVATDLAITFESMREKEASERSVLQTVLKNMLSAKQGILGTWSAWEPNALDGADANWASKEAHDKTGRFIPYWYRTAGQIQVEPLLSYDVPGDGDYYLLAKNSGKAQILEPYIYAVGGVDTLITSLVEPIEVGGRVLGVAGVDIALSQVQANLSQIKPFEGAFLTLVSDQGVIVYHPNADLIGKPLSEANFSSETNDALNAGTSAALKNVIYGEETVFQSVEALKIADTDSVWKLMVTVPTAQVYAATNDMLSKVILITVIILLAAAVVAFFAGSAISNPIAAMTRTMRELATGNLDIDIPAQNRTDEIGEMGNAVKIFRDNAIENNRLQDEQQAQEKAEAQSEALRVQEQQADAERRRQRKEEEARVATNEKRATMSKLADAFQSEVGGVVDSVADASTHMQGVSKDMVGLSETAKDRSGDVSRAAQQMSGNVATVASATEELSASISEISRQVSESTRIASGAVEEVKKTNTDINSLLSEADNISSVVELINDIAEQTNLLALNATIEAARAGDAGRGFAVVASEVKNLAGQTAKATEKITLQIASIQEATRNSVAGIEGIGGTIGKVHEIAASIASAVEEQSAATQEISRSVSDTSRGANEVSTSIDMVSDASTRVNDASNGLMNTAGEMQEQSDRLRLQVDQFLSSIRAG
jgi:methyl-accepting chemotaxis protein